MIRDIDVDMLVAYLDANRNTKVLLEADQVDLILDIIDAYDAAKSYGEDVARL